MAVFVFSASGDGQSKHRPHNNATVVGGVVIVVVVVIIIITILLLLLIIIIIIIITLTTIQPFRDCIITSLSSQLSSSPSSSSPSSASSSSSSSSAWLHDIPLSCRMSNCIMVKKDTDCFIEWGGGHRGFPTHVSSCFSGYVFRTMFY